jgi:hypothetical protein
MMIEHGVREGGTVTVSIKNGEPDFEVKKRLPRAARAPRAGRCCIKFD